MATNQAGPTGPGSAQGATSAAPTDLNVYWSLKEADTKPEESGWEFEIPLFWGKVEKYVFRIICSSTDFFRLMFMFNYKDTNEELQRIFASHGYKFPVVSGERNIGLGSKISAEPTTIRKEITGVIHKAKYNIQVIRAKTALTQEYLTKKCIELCPNFKTDDISVYFVKGNVWVVGRNEEKLKELVRRLKEKKFIDIKQIEEMTETTCNSEGDQNPCIIWSNEKSTKEFEIYLYEENSFRYTIQIRCRPEDFYKLKFIFDHGKTKNKMEKDLSQMNFKLQVVDERVFVNLTGSKSTEKPETIKDFIEKALKTVVNDLLACPAETSYHEKLDERCKEIHPAHLSSDILIYPGEGCSIWLVGRNQEEMKKVFRNLRETGFVISEEQSLTKGTDTGKGQGGTEVPPSKENQVSADGVSWTTSHLQKTSQVTSKTVSTNMSLMTKGLVNDPTKFQNVFRNVEDGSLPLDSPKDGKFEQEDLEQKTDAMTSDTSQKSFKVLQLPIHFSKFLEKSESGRRYIENVLKKNRLRINLICVPDQENKLKILKVFVKRDVSSEEIEGIICKKLFNIPPEDPLCEIFKSNVGRQYFESIVKQKSGKVDMVLMSENQLCCVGTGDIEEEIKKSLRLFLVSMTKTEEIPVTSEVWHFCKEHLKYELEEKGVTINFRQDKESSTPWLIEISGPFQDVILFKSKLESDIKKIRTEIMTIDPVATSSQQLEDPLFWEKIEEGKRCLVGFKAAEGEQRKPWKKWIKKDKNKPVFTYEVNYNCNPPTSDEVHIILCLEEPEQGGARRKTSNDPPFEPLMDKSSEIRKYMIHVRPSSTGKSKDHLAGCFKALFAQEDIQKKEKLVVSCQLLQEKEMNYCTKIICHEIEQIDTISAAYTSLKRCQFYDERPEMFPVLIDIFDDYLRQQDIEVFQWKGRAMNVQVRKGQLALQEDCDVLVNSTSTNLVLEEGVVSKSLLRVAGNKMKDECKLNYKNGIQAGDIAITQGHGLKCRLVFHGAVRRFSKEEKFESLKKMLQTCLKKADDFKMDSIAFPAIGTGQHGYHRKDIANVMFQIVEEYKQRIVEGSLHSVFFVIYDADIDCLREFQEREKKWLKDNAVEKSVVSITSDDPDALEKMCKRIKDALNPVALSEPPENEISEKDRLGLSRKERNQSDTVIKDKTRDTENKDSHSKDEDSASTNVNATEKEKRCLLLQSNPESRAETKFNKENIEQNFSKHNLENVVYPFHGENQALLQFLSKKDCENCMADNYLKREYTLCRFPEQAVVDVKAVLHSKMTEFLMKRNISPKDITEHSGVEVDQSNGCSVILKGNIMEIKAAYEYISSLVLESKIELEQNKSLHMNRKQSQGLMKQSNEKVEEKSIKSTLTKTEKEKSRNNDEFSYTPQTSGINSPVSVLQNVPDMNEMADRQPSHGSSATSMISSLNSVPCATGTIQSLPTKRKMDMTYDDYFLLKHFHLYIFNDAEEKWSKNAEVVNVTFPDEGIVVEVVDMLKNMDKLSKDRIPYPKKNDVVDGYLRSKSKDDLCCYETKYCGEWCIAIVGNDKSEVLQTKKEYEKLLNPDPISRIGDHAGASKSGESLPEEERKPIYTTREGIKVFVYKGSLLNANVEAIICPISKNFDIERGLPKVIADKAGEGFKLGCKYVLKEKGPYLPVGYACRINPGDLMNFKAIINVVSSQWATNKQEECKKDLTAMLMHIFYVAETEKLKSLALPAICSGRAGFPKDVCAKLYANCVVDYSYKARNSRTSIKDIYFVDMSDEMLAVIESVFTNPSMIEASVLPKKEDSLNQSQKPEVLIYEEKPGKYCVNQNIAIYLFDCEALDKKADALVCTIDASFEESPILKVLEKAGKKFKDTLKKFKANKPCSGSVKVSDPPGNLQTNYKHIMCITTPTWTSDLKNSGTLIDAYFKDLAHTNSNILEEARKNVIGSILMPVYGPMKEDEWLVKKSISCLLDEIVKFSLRNYQDDILLSILIASKKKNIHRLVMQGLQDLIDRGPAGFQCRMKQPIRILQRFGDQPRGTLDIKEEMQGLGGYTNNRTIVLDISIPDGKQTKPSHPHPDKMFKGYFGKIYLPNTEKGVKVAEMLRKAFDVGILFTIKSGKEGDFVTYTDIPLKTARFGGRYGYPDPDYLDKVMRILKTKLGE